MMAIACWSFLAVAADTVDVHSISRPSVARHDRSITLVNRFKREAFILCVRAGWTPIRVEGLFGSAPIHMGFDSEVFDLSTPRRFRFRDGTTEGWYPDLGPDR